MGESKIIEAIKLHLQSYLMNEFENDGEEAAEEVSDITLDTTSHQFAHTQIENSDINVFLNVKDKHIQKELVVDSELIIYEYINFESYGELIEYLRYVCFESAISFDKIDAYELAGV